jgi:pimeloyl-ACP methyl ester carboxylesterase
MKESRRDKRVTVGGASLAVREAGSGPPVLLINGTAPALWGRLPEMLAESHRVIDYDRRSFGESPAPSPKDPRRHAEDAAVVLTRLRATPALLVGWSMGAVIALELACRHAELVTGLVLLEPPFRAKQHPRPAMLRAVVGATLLGRLGHSAAGAERFLSWALARRDGSSAYDDAGPGWREEVRRHGAAIVSELDAGEHLDRRAIARVTTPTSILAGSETDPVFTGAARRLAAIIPAAELVCVPNSSHAIPFDAAPVVANIVQYHSAEQVPSRSCVE